jgi:hypothetical protein
VDAERGEVSRVIQLSSTQWAAAGAKADELAAGLAGLDESVQLAVVAALLGRFSEPRPLLARLQRAAANENDVLSGN